MLICGASCTNIKKVRTESTLLLLHSRTKSRTAVQYEPEPHLICAEVRVELCFLFITYCYKLSCFLGKVKRFFVFFRAEGEKNFERLWEVANGRRRWEGGAGHATLPDFFHALISLESGKLALRAQTVPPSRQLTRKKPESLANVPPHLPTSSCFVPPEQFKLVFLGSPDENGFTADAVNPVLDKVSLVCDFF